jgi:CheY-like chemotaxis protein
MYDSILIIEDDDDDLFLIKKGLQKARISNALHVARDGVEALERLRGDARTKTLPIVILTSSDEQEDLLRSYKLGVNSYVRKPIDFSQFQETIGKIGLYWLSHPLISPLQFWG